MFSFRRKQDLSVIHRLRAKKAFAAAIAACDAGRDSEVFRLERAYLLMEAGKLVEADDALRSHGSLEASLVLSRGKVGRFFDTAEATFQPGSISGIDGSLAKYGCALIKGLFDLAVLSQFDARIEKNISGIDDAMAAAGAPRNLNVGYPLYFAGGDPTEVVQRAFCASYPSLFNVRRMKGLDCTSLLSYVFGRLRDTGLNRVLSNRLGLKRLSTSAAACHIRAFTAPPKELIEEAHRGAEFHQDNRLYNVEPEIFTLWFPFRYEHGAMASLEFLPIRSATFLPCVKGCGIDRSLFAPEAFWSPAYELGDAVIISGYCPHRTYYPHTVRKERTSIDVRFFPTRLPAPIYE